MIDMIVTVPKGFSLALPNNPTPQQQAVHNAIQSIDGQWVYAGSTGTNDLFCVITRSDNLADIEALIVQYGLPITVLHAQNAHLSPQVDAQGNPVLDANGQQAMDVVVHRQAKAADLLHYMSDVPVLDAQGNVIGTQRPTTVSLPVWGGHENWRLA